MNNINVKSYNVILLAAPRSRPMIHATNWMSHKGSLMGRKTRSKSYMLNDSAYYILEKTKL